MQMEAEFWCGCDVAFGWLCHNIYSSSNHPTTLLSNFISLSGASREIPTNSSSTLVSSSYSSIIINRKLLMYFYFKIKKNSALSPTSFTSSLNICEHLPLVRVSISSPYNYLCNIFFIHHFVSYTIDLSG